MTTHRSVLRSLALIGAASAWITVTQPAVAFGVLIYAPEAEERCSIERVQYTENWYNATGHCEEFNKRGAASPVHVPFSAVGRYDSSTREAHETIRIVKGGLDIPTHYYYGTITSTLSCGADPWQQSTIDCGVTNVSATETIPQYFVDSLVRKRRRPFTSDLTDAQRAAVTKQYLASIHRLHERVEAHPGTGVLLDSGGGGAKPAQTMSAAGGALAPSTRGKEVAALSALHAGGTTIRAPEPMADAGRSPPATKAASLRTIEILEPAAGSTVRQGQLRVRIRDSALGTETSNGMATVELSALAPRAAGPGQSPSHPSQVETWQVPLAQLVQGAPVPRNVSAGFVGPTLLRVRTTTTGTWSDSVSFDVTSDAGAQPRTHALPDWSAAPAASSAARLGNAPGSAASAAGAPVSSFGR